MDTTFAGTTQHYRHPLERDDGSTAWHAWSCNFADADAQRDVCMHAPCSGLGRVMEPYSVNPFVADRPVGEVAPTSVYRLFDDAGTLLYVGITAKGLKMQMEHAAAHHWYDDVSNIAVEHYPTRESARAVEKMAILAEHPLHNIER
jgi:hypothetical protein